MEKETKNFYGLVETTIAKDSINEEARTFNEYTLPTTCPAVLDADKKDLKINFFENAYKMFNAWTDLPSGEIYAKVYGIARFTQHNWADGNITLMRENIEEIFYNGKWHKYEHK